MIFQYKLVYGEMKSKRFILQAAIIFVLSAILKFSALNASMLNPNVDIIQIGHGNIINGLEWLDFSQTAGLSVNDALANNPGFRLSFQNEFDEMFSLFGIGSDNKYLGDELTFLNYINDNGSGIAQYSGDLLNYNLNTYDSFMDVFGITSAHSNSGGIFKSSSGLYDAGNGLLGRGGTRIDLHKFTYDSYWELYDYTYNVANSSFYYNNASGLGAFLVKDVPEPSMFALFGIGILGLGISFCRYRKNKKGAHNKANSVGNFTAAPLRSAAVKPR